MKLVTLIIVSISSAFGARILGVVPTPSYSHQVIFQPLWKELSLRGHQVTTITTNLIKDTSLTNLTEIDVSHAFHHMQNQDFTKTFSIGPHRIVLAVLEYFNMYTTMELEHPDVRALIENKAEHFDVLVVEGLNPIMYYFAERFKCPFIKMVSLEAYAKDYRMMGNPTSPALYPDFMLPHSGRLDFWQRLDSFLFEIFVLLADRYVGKPAQEEIVRKYFGEGLPSVEEMDAKVSMMFVNTNPILDPIRALLPNIVQIGGGTHLKTQKPLAEDLKKKLDSTGKHGFIYFSLGSNVKSKDIPVETRRSILRVFAQLPQLILWKLEVDELPDKPSNVIISKWFPQQAVLSHPNAKLFITQGGLQSLEESIHNSVPIIGIPIGADQPKNVRILVEKGLGLALDINTINEDNFMSTIKEVLENPKYKQAVRKLAQLAQDQPMTGLEKAVWWTEYVIRHKGAQHLRSPALDLPWYQYFLLDVVAFITTSVVLIFAVLYKLLKLAITLLKKLFTSTRKVKTS